MDALEIPLRGRNKSIRAWVIVDTADEWVSNHRWHLTADGYAARSAGHGRANRTVVRMHREILGLHPHDGLEADHINGDTLDNRRKNLRVATRAQQMQNQRPRVNSSTSRYRGVDLHQASGLWRARVKLGGKTMCKYFRVENEAATWAASMREIHMEYAVDR